jgi:hypothetical protein
MKKILTQVSDWLKRKFKQGYDAAKKHSHVAVKVTDGLRKVVASPVADLLTAIIPGDLDNELKFKLRQELPKIAAKVAIAHNILQATEDPTLALSRIREYIASLGEIGQRAWWVDFSAHVMEAISDGDLSWDELQRITQKAYAEIHKNEA